MSVSLGKKLNNPFCIKSPGPHKFWAGQSGEDSRGHAQFVSPEYAVRAVVRQLANYSRRGLRTVGQWLAEYAPASDTVGSLAGAPANCPREYAEFVCGKCGIGPNDVLSVYSSRGAIRDRALLAKILKAMARYESLWTLDDGVIQSGMELYERAFV